MFQMSIRASRATRLLVAVGVAWLGLALSAQAAHATYSRVQIVKINQGGDANDVFTFDTSLKPAASPASFNLKGGQSSSIYGVECNVGSSCTSQWGNSVQTITERAAAGYTLTAIACYHTQGTNGWPSEPNTSSALDTDTTSDVAARKINFKLNWWEWTKCYVTNTRDTGTIKVTKKLVPATDGGKFNLLIDGQAKATNVGDGGTTGVQTVLPGTHTVGEAAGTATDLSNYDSSTSCVDKAHTAKPADTDGSLAVAKGDQWDCVITNTRKTTPTPPPPPQEPPTNTPPVQPPAQVVSPTPQVARQPRASSPGQRDAERSQRLPDHQRGGGHRLGSTHREGDVLRRRQEGQDAHQGQPQRPLGAADEREALRVRHPPRPGDRPVRQVQPDQGQDAAAELQPLPLGRRQAAVHRLS